MPSSSIRRLFLARVRPNRPRRGTYRNTSSICEQSNPIHLHPSIRPHQNFIFLDAVAVSAGSGMRARVTDGASRSPPRWPGPLGVWPPLLLGQDTPSKDVGQWWCRGGRAGHAPQPHFDARAVHTQLAMHGRRSCCSSCQ